MRCLVFVVLLSCFIAGFPAISVSVALELPTIDSMILPLVPFEIGGYGFAETVGARRHLGADIRAKGGDPVRSLGDGYVIFSRQRRPGYQQYIVVKHRWSDGTIFYVVYGHLSRRKEYPMIPEKSFVKREDVIGYVGFDDAEDENGIGGEHLHIGVYLSERPKDSYVFWGYTGKHGEDVDYLSNGTAIGGRFTDPLIFLSNHRAQSPTSPPIPLVLQNQTFTPNTYHKQDGSNTVYLAHPDGRLWPIFSGSVLFALTGKRDYGMVENHPSKSLDRYNRGQTIGQVRTLYKDARTGPEYAAIYAVTNDEPGTDGNGQPTLGEIRRIASPKVFELAGFDWREVLLVPEAVLNKYTYGSTLGFSDIIPVFLADADDEALTYLAALINQEAGNEQDGESLMVRFALAVEQGSNLVITPVTANPSGGGNIPDYSQLTPEIKVDITSLNFGEVEVGERGDLSFWVKNPGKGMLEITLDFPFAPYLPQFWTEPAPSSQRFSVSVGDSQRVEVFFTPSSTLPIAGTLILSDNVGGVDDPRISLIGRGKRTVPRQIITITDTLTDGMIMPPFVRIKAGTVLMGAAADDPYIRNMGLERPQQVVYISKDFYLCPLEVTPGFWRAIAGDIPITWNNAINIFLPRLNALAPPGVVFRMPTECSCNFAVFPLR